MKTAPNPTINKNCINGSPFSIYCCNQPFNITKNKGKCGGQNQFKFWAKLGSRLVKPIPCDPYKPG